MISKSLCYGPSECGEKIIIIRRYDTRIVSLVSCTRTEGAPRSRGAWEVFFQSRLLKAFQGFLPSKSGCANRHLAERCDDKCSLSPKQGRNLVTFPKSRLGAGRLRPHF